MFVYKWNSDFVILVVYVDDINLVGTLDACRYATDHLKLQFDIKLLGQTTICLGLQIAHLQEGSMFLHQTAYIWCILKRFRMEHSNALAAPLMGRSCTNQDPYIPALEEDKELDKPRYLAAVGALLYLATFTRPDISFAVSVLGRQSQKPTSRHCAGIKHLFCYLRGTKDLGLLYTKDGASNFVKYTDAGYKSDVNSRKFQTSYIFLRARALVSWKLVKQIETTTSTNHSKLLAFHEASRELV